MLLANTAVAKQIAFGLPEQALLRRHEGPIERRIVSLSECLALHAGRICQASQETRVRVRWSFRQDTAAGL